MRFVRPLAEVVLADRAEVGGKAATLGELARRGFAVPPGFVLTTAARDAWADRSRREQVRTELMEAFHALGAQRVAVRSSGVAEDGEAASWAGQLESFLSVGQEQLEAAVMGCWESTSSPRALAYARDQAGNRAAFDVAVIVQAMVASRCAGVLFTLNPVSGARDECVIEAVYGLGETLVQGRATPDTFVAEKATGTLRVHHPHRQSTLLHAVNGHTELRTLDERERSAATLDAPRVAELVSIGTRIEAAFGSPQDVEWAHDGKRFQIVQSRPITGLPGPDAPS